jgi:hypothetical protein
MKPNRASPEAPASTASANDSTKKQLASVVWRLSLLDDDHASERRRRRVFLLAAESIERLGEDTSK